MSEIKVNSIKGVAASSAAITISNTDGTCTANITNKPNRNLIINGAMQVAQRGTSSTTNGYGSVDRFGVFHTGTDEAPTQAQVDVASGTTPYTLGFRKALKVTNGNQTSGAGASDYIRITNRIEAGDMAQSGWNYVSSSSNITLSFWVKSSVAQNFYGVLFTRDGTRQNYPFETGSLSADTWTKVTKTISGNSNIQFDTDTQDNANYRGLDINIVPFYGTTYTSSVSLNAWVANTDGNYFPDNTSTWYTTNDATFEITGVQLEVSDHASDFQFRSFAEELALCQRYYIFNGAGMGNAGKSYSMSGMDMPVTVNYGFPVQMRATPSVTTTNVNIRDDSNNSISANINSLSKFGHQYGVKKVAGQSEEYGVSISDFKYDAEL